MCAQTMARYILYMQLRQQAHPKMIELLNKDQCSGHTFYVYCDNVMYTTQIYVDLCDVWPYKALAILI